MLWRGFAVGVLISAPMGPVGILCIQRTLDKGRKAGFYTGIGAAISDLFYCLLTGFGLSFIEDFLQENQNVIQLFGSIVLIAFSIYLFRKNPSSSLRRPLPQNVSAKKNILGGFLFTFSNPLIIFLIIGLFARFNFTAPEIKGGFYAIGYLFIIVGALCWWYGVTYLIERVRTKFNMRSMKRLNIAIGIVILGFACVGIVTSILNLTSARAGARNYAPPLSLKVDTNSSGTEIFSNSQSDDLVIPLFSASKNADRLSPDCRPDSIAEFQLDFKVANLASGPGKKYYYFDSDGRRIGVKSPSWGIELIGDSGEVIRLDFRQTEYSPTPLSSQSAILCEASLPGGYSCSRYFYSGVNTASGLNHFRLKYDPVSGPALRIGNHSLCSPIRFIAEDEDEDGVIVWPARIENINLRLSPASEVEYGYSTLRIAPNPDAMTTTLSASGKENRIRHSSDPIEGRWRQLDFTLDEDYIKSGGEYELSILRADDGIYEIIYEDGALIRATDWHKGESIKALMKPSGISGVYDVEWRDANGLVLSGMAKAQLESSDLLTIHFPGRNSNLRFARVK